MLQNKLIAMELYTEIRGSQRMDHTDFLDPVFKALSVTGSFLLSL